MQIEDALAKFVLQLEANGRSSHTIGQYHRHVRLFATWALQEGLDEEIEGLSHESLAKFLSSEAARRRPDGAQKKATSANALRSSLRCFFSYLHEAGYVRENPARMVRLARCGSPPPRALSEDEQRKLVAYLAEAQGPTARRDEALYCTMLFSGIRIGSALALDVEDVDLARGEIRLRHAKGDREEVVYIPPQLSDLLQTFLADRESGPLFTGPGGKRISQRHVQRRFGETLTKAGVTRALSCHSMRHRFATDLYQRTGDIFLVQQALRHRSIVSTLVYAKMDELQLREALRA